MKTKWFERFKKISVWVVLTQMILAFFPVTVTAAAHTLVGWTFPENSADALVDVSIPSNTTRQITAYNVGTIKYDQGGAGTGHDKSAATDHWDEGDYWKIEFSSIGYSGLSLHSEQWSEDKGPRDWQVWYRVGSSGNWTAVGGEYQITNASWNNAGNKDWQLPSAVNNKNLIQLKWRVMSNQRATGGDREIDSHAKSGIDNIFVTASGIIDVTPPVFNPYSDIEEYAHSASGAVVNFATPTATDNSGQVPTVSCDYANDYLFPIGETTVTCTATDSSGNSAQMTFRVTILNNKPVITLNGDAEITIERGSTYIEPGAVWNDVEDGSGTVTNISGSVNEWVVATYNIYYDFTDSLGLAATQVRRQVHVIDTTGPRITFVSPTPESGSTLTADSFRIMVETDEAVSCELELSGSSYPMTSGAEGRFYYDVSSLGDGYYQYKVTCEDAYENESEATRDVTIDITGPDVQYVEPPTPEDGLVTQDDTPRIEVTTDDAEYCELYMEGFKPIEMNRYWLEPVSVAVSRISLSHDFYYQFEESLDEGEYEYYVRCYDEPGNTTDADTRTFIIDQTPPILTLVGDPVVTLIVGSSYTDARATAFDNEDGDLTDKIVRTGSYDVNTIGAYKLYFDVSDSAGNAATQVSRTINVVAAPIPPVTPPTVLTPIIPVAAAAPAVAAPVAAAEEVLGEETAEPVNKADDQGEVKGSSDKICPWWWIIGLLLIVVLGFTGGVVKAEDEDSKIRKYWYVWPPVFGGAAWLLHLWLHNDFKATWFCDNYWLVVLLIALVAEAVYGFLAKKSQR